MQEITNGTPKQIAWAVEIREKMIARVKAAREQAEATALRVGTGEFPNPQRAAIHEAEAADFEKILERLTERISDARWFINYKDRDAASLLYSLRRQREVRGGSPRTNLDHGLLIW